MSKMKPPENEDMLPEYDFSGKKGVRGKYYEAYRQGHTVRVYQEDGSVDIKYFTLEDGAVMLEPDVRAHFPTSESVNQALRKLMARKKPAAKIATSKSTRKNINT